MEEKTAIKEAFTELAPRYEKTVNNELQKFWGINYKDFIDTLINKTETNTGEKILDVATGTCLIPRRLVEKQRNVNISGIDITFDMLKNGKEKINKIDANSFISLTTGDAMLMPFRSNIFDVVMCGLATHHMDVPKLLNEINRILKPEGRFSLGDVGGSKLWKFALIQFIIKILAFFYFLFTENVERAWAEAKAVSNVQTAESWEELLSESGFTNIEIQKLRSKKFWVPDPLIIQAQKPNHFPGEEA